MSLRRALKWYRSLSTAKGRRKEGFFIVEGVRQVEQVVLNAALNIEEIICIDNVDLTVDFQVNLVSEREMKQITARETTPEIIAVVKIPLYELSEIAENATKILFLEDVQDPGNVGTLIRSAVAFGFDAVMLTDNSADPYAPKVVRSTGGAIGEVKILRKKELLKDIMSLKQYGFQIVTAHIGGGKSMPLELPKTIFALGNEGNGISDSLKTVSDFIYTIPFQTNKIESLNVAIAGSIGMSQLFKGV